MKWHLLAITLCTLFFASTANAVTHVAESSLSKSFAGVAKKSMPAVVYIRVVKPVAERKGMSPFEERGDDDFFGNEFFRRFFEGPFKDKGPDIGQASGFLISSDGYILTNGHVISDASEITVTLSDGTSKEAKVIGHDPNTDVALIKIEGKDLPFLVLSNSDDIDVGEWVVAIGNPFGLRATMTAGIVSAKGRNNLDLIPLEDFIQTDAAINEGNSGGPLLNLDGGVIGINTARGYPGIGFAIPSNLAKYVMDQLQRTGSVKRGFLGVTLQEITANLATAFGMERLEGALVSDVAPLSPAEKAGVKRGDVILVFNGHPVRNMGSLRTEVALVSPGTEVNMVVMREGKEKSVAIEVGTFPEKDAKVDVSANSLPSKIGFVVTDVTQELARKYRLNEEKGVVITRVENGTAAALAGLKPGAVVVSINNQPIENADEFSKTVAGLEKGKPVLLLVRQQGGLRFLSFKLAD